MARAREERQWTSPISQAISARDISCAGAAHLQVILALFVQVPDRSYFLRHRDVAQFR